jgi:hypothetical protein
MICKAKVREYMRDTGYRLSADAWIGLEEAVRLILNRAVSYTRPAKTIRAKEILMSVGKRAH